MNISQLLQHLTHMKSGELQKTELRPGQWVKATVLKMQAGHEALLSIQGTTIRAILESPLKPGAAGWFQVLPNSTGDELQLRHASFPQRSGDAGSIAQLLQQLQMKNTTANRGMIQQLLREGLPVNKQNASFLQLMTADKPANAIPANWNKAALIVMHKGLPLTGEAVQAIHQLLYGTKLHENIKQLQQQLQNYLQPQAVSRLAKDTVSTVQQLQAQLQQLVTNSIVPLTSQGPSRFQQAASATPDVTPPTLSTAATHSSPSTGTNGPIQAGNNQTAGSGGSAAVAASLQLQLGMERTSSNIPVKSLASAFFGNRTEAAPAMTVPIQSANPAQGHANDQPMVHRQTISQPVPQSITPLNVQAAQPTTTTLSNSGGAVKYESLPREAMLMDSNGIAAPAVPTSSPLAESSVRAPAEPLILQLLKALGIHREHELSKLFLPLHANNLSDLQPPGNQHQTQQDQIKGLLLKLQTADDLPAALKDSAQQLQQQITGQQLMLTTDRLPYSHTTFMLPFFNKTGEQTASVTIQSKKGRSHQLDADNCRLLFDLAMNSLGNMILDVQVADKYVRLKILNDDSLLPELLEGMKPLIAEGLGKIGYRLQSVTSSAYPMAETDLQNDQSASDYRVQEQWYKGVDLRI